MACYGHFISGAVLINKDAAVGDESTDEMSSERDKFVNGAVISLLALVNSRRSTRLSGSHLSEFDIKESIVSLGPRKTPSIMLTNVYSSSD